MPLRHALARRVVAIARIQLDVVGADDALTLEGRREHGGVPWHRELLKGGTRRAGERVEHVALAGLVDDVVEEGAEVGAGQLDTCIHRQLNNLIKVLLGRGRCSDAVEQFEGASLVLARLLGEVGLRCVGALAQHADDGAVGIAHGIVDEGEEAFLLAAIRLPEPCCCGFQIEAFASGIDPVEHLEEALALDVGERFPDRLADPALAAERPDDVPG